MAMVLLKEGEVGCLAGQWDGDAGWTGEEEQEAAAGAEGWQKRQNKDTRKEIWELALEEILK